MKCTTEYCKTLQATHNLNSFSDYSYLNEFLFGFSFSLEMVNVVFAARLANNLQVCFFKLEFHAFVILLVAVS
jgi:hypothetical protein